jgi:hypothetical protein
LLRSLFWVLRGDELADYIKASTRTAIHTAFGALAPTQSDTCRVCEIHVPFLGCRS